MPATATGEVVSSYPNTFIDYTTYTIDGRYINSEVSYTVFTVGSIEITHPNTDQPYMRTETNLYVYWDDPNRAPAPDVSFTYDKTSGRMVLSGADSSMEYRLKSQSSSSWKPCTDEPMYFDCTTSQIPYYVRYAAENDDRQFETD